MFITIALAAIPGGGGAIYLIFAVNVSANRGTFCSIDNQLSLLLHEVVDIAVSKQALKICSPSAACGFYDLELQNLQIIEIPTTSRLSLLASGLKTPWLHCLCMTSTTSAMSRKAKKSGGSAFCAVYGCSNKSGEVDEAGNRISFFSFPPDDPQLRSFESFTGRCDPTHKTKRWRATAASSICHLHFDPRMYKEYKDESTGCITRRVLLTLAVPSLKPAKIKDITSHSRPSPRKRTGDEENTDENNGLPNSSPDSECTVHRTSSTDEVMALVKIGRSVIEIQEKIQESQEKVKCCASPYTGE